MDEIFHVLTDPAHWIAEVVMDTTLMFLALPLVKRIVKRHDRRKHGLKEEGS
jgi:hypothetical protein